MSDRVKDAGKPTMGTDLPFENVSALGANRLQVRKHAPQRDQTTGRFAARKQTQVGPLGPPGGIGPGGIDATTGRWLPNVRNSAQLHDLVRTHEISAGHAQYVSPDWSHAVDPARASNEGLHAAQNHTNNVLSCPSCAAMGA